MEHLILPDSYQSALNLHDTQIAINAESVPRIRAFVCYT